MTTIEQLHIYVDIDVTLAYIGQSQAILTDTKLDLSERVENGTRLIIERDSGTWFATVLDVEPERGETWIEFT